MATIYVYSAAAGANNGTSWANAFTTITAALATATSADTINIASDHSESTAGAVTMTCPTTPGLKALSVDRTTGALTFGATIAVGAASNSISVQGHGYWYGVQFFSASNSSSTAVINIGSLDTRDHGLFFENCLFRVRAAHASMRLRLGPTASVNNDECFIRLVDCSYRISAVGQGVLVQAANVEIINFTMDTAGSTPTSMFTGTASTGQQLTVMSSDLSNMSWTNLVAVGGVCAGEYKFINCKFPSGWNALSSTASSKSFMLWVLDCAVGDTHGFFGYYDPLGSIVSSTTTLLTGSPAGQSWGITTTSLAKPMQPFTTPWISWYNTGTSAITPYLECLRNNGTASAYNNSEVFAEFLVKDVASSTVSTLHSSGAGPIGTPVANSAGIGTGSWTIASSSSPYSFKCVAPSAITPAEVGHIRARLSIGFTGTIYLNPQIEV